MQPRAHNLSIVDFFSTLDDVPELPQVLLDSDATRRDTSLVRRLSALARILHPEFWFMLFLLGILTACVSYGMDISIRLLLEARYKWLSSGGGFVYLMFLLLSSVVCGVISTWTCHVLSRDAAGSGIPEMKAILSGVVMKRYLSVKCLLAKVIGLVSAIAGGLFVGKEGPFVHVAAAIANQLGKLRPFTFFTKTPTRRLSVLSAAVSAGVTATFGTPMGAVLFSIEVTSTFVMVNALWKSYFCSIWCVITFKLLHQFALVELFAPTELPAFEPSWELLLFAILGIVCGILGGTFVHLCSKILELGCALQRTQWSKYIWTVSIMGICTLVVYWVPYLSNMDRHKINALFSNRDPEAWVDSTTSLSLFTLFRLMATPFSIACCVPCGVFTPVFVAGASFGRLFGIVIHRVIPAASPAAAYAVVAAASLTASVTRTISVSVIVFELTGQLNMMLPVLLGVLLSYLTGAAMSISIYDMILIWKKLPYLPGISSADVYYLTAQDLMVPAKPFSIPARGVTLADALIASRHAVGNMMPVVDSTATQLLIGSISVTAVEKMAKRYKKTAPRSRFRIRGRTQEIQLVSLDSRPSSPDSNTEFNEAPTSSTTNAGNDPLPTIGPAGPSDPVELELEGEYHMQQLRDIPFDVESAGFDSAPLFVLPRTPMSKVHFLFTMLSLGNLFVCDRNEACLLGVIVKNAFNRMEEASYARVHLNSLGDRASDTRSYQEGNSHRFRRFREDDEHPFTDGGEFRIGRNSL